MLFDDVKSYIEGYILHSASFDSVDESVQRKAVNNAEQILLSYYKKYNDKNPLPIEAIAFQTVYILSKDDTSKRVDDGATYVGFNGVALTYAQVNRQISPDVVRLLGRRVGSYQHHVSGTDRGMYDQ